ncbi:MAG: zinc ribbon domain-containing protein [Oscillospiraceae bacterium]
MSKFCGNCGTPADDNEVFCGNCGARFDQDAVNEQPAPAQPAPEPAPQYDQSGSVNDPAAFVNDGGVAASPANKGKFPVVIIAALAAVIVLIVLIVVILKVTRVQKIDAKELFDIEFAGPDGYGQCYAQLDIDPYFAFAEYGVDMTDYSITYKNEDYEKIKYSKYFAEKGSKLESAYDKASDRSEAKDMRDELLKVDKKKGEFKLKCKLSKEKGLKNGDKVTVEVVYDEEALKDVKVKLENTSFEVEVKGLEKSKTVDPFADFKPEFSGFDGEGTASYDYDGSGYSFVSIYADSSTYSLSNGDTVTFRAEAYVYDTHYLDEKDHSKGFWFISDEKLYVWPYEETSVTKDYTVEGLTGLNEIDPFENITFEYSGATPFLRISSVSYTDEASSLLRDYTSISIDQDYDTRYKAGDKFTVRAYAYSGLSSEGYKLKGTVDSDGYVTKEFTVGAEAPAYVDSTNAADADADSAINDMFVNKETDAKQDAKGDKYFNGDSLDDYIKSIKSLEKTESYLLFNVATDYDSIGWSESVNSIVRLYTMDVKLENGKSAKLYVVMELSNIIVDESGFTTSDSVDVTFFVKESDAIDAIEGLEGYTKTKIGEASAPAETPDESSSAAETTESKADETASEADSKADASSEELVP